MVNGSVLKQINIFKHLKSYLATNSELGKCNNYTITKKY